jgi:ABC-type iron transport system FetAB permease component
LCNFRLESSSLQLQNLSMLHLLVWSFITFSQRLTLAFILNLIFTKKHWWIILWISLILNAQAHQELNHLPK